MIQVQSLPLDFFVGALNEHHPFAFARYGDGEWNAILGVNGENCDGHAYFAELGEELRNTLVKRRAYFYAVGPKARNSKTLGTRVEDWLTQYAPRTIWFDSETLLTASLEGQLLPFVNALRKKRVLVVGPKHLEKLRGVFGDAMGLVIIPDRNAYLTKADIERGILKRAAHADVILLSAGPVAKVMVYDLFPQLKSTHTLIGCGSLWDMYCGKDSRRYARRMSAERKAELGALNFGARS